MADIFLSYASEDRDRVRPLVESLEEHGWSVWWDREIHAGPRFDQVIEEEIDKAFLCSGGLVKGICEVRLGTGRSE